MGVLSDEGVVCELRRAWEESRPGTAEGHEEGGFVVKRDDGKPTVVRWPLGIQDRIEVPEHPGGRFQGAVIIATFHTHPNFGPEYQQEPSLTDIRAVRNDPDLRHAKFEGEYVISQDMMYVVLPDGKVEALGQTSGLLSISREST
jgi:hypothetical protein